MNAIRYAVEFLRRRQSSHLEALAEWGILFLLTAFLIFAGFLSGCAETQADFQQHKKIIDPDTGLVVYEKRTDTGSFARAPGDAATATTQSVTERGVHASVSGVHATTPEQIIAQNQEVLLWIGPGFMAAGVLAFVFLKNKPLAVGLGIVGGVCLGTPMFLNEIGPYVVPLVGLAGVGAVTVWWLANRHASNRSSKLAAEHLAEADRLGKLGQYVEALDAMRSGIVALETNKPVFAGELKRKQ